MDTWLSIDDQFSKLHPCFPIDTKIGIVGGGVSGLSAAYALSKLGYTHIAILEKHHSVGGMCESVEIEGRIYDLGGQVLAANSAPAIFHLAKEVGAESEEMDSHKFATIDSTGKYNDMNLVDDYLSVVPLTLKLQEENKASGRIGIHAVSDIASDSASAFLQGHGIESVPKSVAYGYTASGYGFIQDMPYAYLHEFTRTSMAGKVRRFKGGYMRFWEKISNSLPIQICCNTEVVSVRRNSDGVSINVRGESGELQVTKFDKIIFSGSFPFNRGRTYRSPSPRPMVPAAKDFDSDKMDMNDLEKDLFSKVQTMDFYTTVLKIKGLEHLQVGFYYFGEFMEDPVAIGYPVAMQKFYADTDIFLFWSYGNSADIKEEKVMDLTISVIKRMGAEVGKRVLQRRFKYFPHVNSQDMKDGFYDKLEYGLQGKRNTYFVGGIVAFELTERNSSYAMALVCKHFASDDPLSSFPYVKRLSPLQLNCKAWFAKQLNETPGIDFPNLSTLDGFLRHWGTHSVTQKKTFCTWINHKGETEGQRTYHVLHTNASEIAYRLLVNQKPEIKTGDRVLLVYLPGLEFLDAFFGCLRARIIPVPVIPPDPSKRSGQALLHLVNIAQTCNATAILSTSSYHLAVRATSAKNLFFLSGKSKKSSQWPDLPWLHTDSWIKKSKLSMNLDEIGNQPEPQADDLCFLQFTSGSTGVPKGVMITHGGLVHNVKLMRKTYKCTSNTIAVSWLPQYHDMGLIGGIFTCLVSGGSAVLFSPATFIKNPIMWLETMSKYQATHSAGPNFSFELIVRRLEANKEKVQNFDLSSMVFLMTAAEPVRSKTLKRFLELTQPWGLSQEVMAPGYGLAENCVYVSTAFGEGKPILIDWQGRVGCGYVNSNNCDVDIRIVNPETGVENQESRKEGEIWISSPSAAIGYWGMEELSHKTFMNELKNHPGKRYTRTGDLGQIIDGNLFITGRIKDLIIVAGRNVYASDVEKTVESSSEFVRPGCCVVVGVPEETLMAKGISLPAGSDQVGLVVIAEVRDNKPLPKYAVEKIQICIAEEHGINIALIVQIKAKTIGKTTSGKIKRFDCLKQFTDGVLNVVEESVQSRREACQSQLSNNLLPRNPNVNRTEIINFLKELLSEMTGISNSNISTTENLISYGVDSIAVVRAAQKLSAFLGIPIGAIDIFTASCIEDLANFSENLLAKSRPQSVAPPSHLPESKPTTVGLRNEASPSYKLQIWILQLLALVCVSFLLAFPAYVSVSVFSRVISASNSLTNAFSWFHYVIPLVCSPLAWMFCMFCTCIVLAFFGKPFLLPNYVLSPEISIWSVDFVKWWALYKAQQVSSRILAVHLKGTVFLNHWFQLLGAKIGSSVLLDSVDITDPSLVSIGDGAVIAEGALVQSHEVKNGILSFKPIRIGRFSSVGPSAVIQRGSTVDDGTDVQALQTSQENGAEKGKMIQQSRKKTDESPEFIYHFFGIYMVGLLSSLSAAISYFVCLYLLHRPPTRQHFELMCICGAFHWLPYTIVAYATLFTSVPSSPITFATSIGLAYLVHGIILSILTCGLNNSLFRVEHSNKTCHMTWLRHRITISCHLRFAKFLSGTEAFCIYLRLLGAKIGKHCSIRSINAISEPRLMSISDGVHLGDFCRIIPGFYSANGFLCGKIEIQENSVVGSQSLVLPDSVIEKDVILGALSVAPMNSLLQKGGVYVGTQTPVMVKNTMHTLDDRIQEMDMKYKKVLGNLATSFAASTLKVHARFFHRIGAEGKGFLQLYNDIPGLPDHEIFSPGKKYPIILRHSNCLSSDDDARADPRGAAIRILPEESGDHSIHLDLTLKTGNAFHARTIGDFATWLVCGAAAREEHVKHAPHIREAMWDSLRRPDSYAELHYYSNSCRLFRCKNGREMYVKFKLRPFDEKITEDSGKVEPKGILPPETGSMPREEHDIRPLLFLDEDFQQRVRSPNKVRYVLQLQIQEIPNEEGIRETLLDCTKAWRESEVPYIEVGEITLDQILTKEESEHLEFNPFLKCQEVDVIRATSCSQSASLDHGRSLVYAICQHLRNKKPIPEDWRIFLDQADVKVNLSGCPMAAELEKKKANKVTLERPWYMTLWTMIAQPLLQTVLPYFLMGLIIFSPLNWVLYLKEVKKLQLQWLLPLFWVISGMIGGLFCVVLKWILVGTRNPGETVLIWSKETFTDTIWQSISTLVGDYFMEMTSGSFLFGLYMKLMGSEIAWDEGVYVDSMGAILNPEMVRIEKNGCVGREAILFGHIYEGEEGKVKFGKINIEEGGFVGSRAVAMPGVTVESGGTLGALSLAMKEETIR